MNFEDIAIFTVHEKQINLFFLAEISWGIQGFLSITDLRTIYQFVINYVPTPEPHNDECYKI